MTIDDLLNRKKLSKAELAELAGELRRYGTKDLKAVVDRKRPKAADLRAAVHALAERGRRGRVTHLGAMGGQPACVVEEGKELTLLELLLAPVSCNGEPTCKGCREAAGLDAEEAAALAAAEEAQVEAERLAAQPKPRPAMACRVKAGTLSDGSGVDLKEATDVLRIVFSYKGTDHAGLLWANGDVTMGAAPSDERYKSPSAAARSITHSAVNGWARWRYQATDGEHYPIKRLRGEATRPVRGRGRPVATDMAGMRKRLTKLLDAHGRALSKAAEIQEEIDQLTIAMQVAEQDGEPLSLQDEARLDDSRTADAESINDSIGAHVA